jgi:hypothetical protein
MEPESLLEHVHVVGMKLGECQTASFGNLALFKP